MRMAVLTLTIILFIPIGSAAQSGLAYYEATTSSLKPEGGGVIAIDGSGELLASGHDGAVAIFEFPSMTEIGSVILRNEVTNLKFSPNSNFLYVGLKASGGHTESLQKIAIDNGVELLSMSSSISSHARAMDIHPNGGTIALSDDDMGVSLFSSEDLLKIDELTGEHLDDISCIDYSNDGEMIVTGDDNGLMVLRNLSNDEVISKWNMEGIPTSCSISSDGSRVLSSGENGNVMIREVASENSISTDSGVNCIARWSESETRVNVLVKGQQPKMLIMLADDLSMIYETSLFHQANDLVVIENDREIVESLLIATGTGNVAHYVRDIARPTTNEVDRDRDGIPNMEDLDADGDGIIKWWDINCESGIECDNDPDLETIRRITIEISEEELRIRDAVFFNMDQSAIIRNISRSALVVDQSISTEEIELFSDSVCANLDPEDLAEKWQDMIKLSSGGFSGNAEIECKVLDGMYLVSSEDYQTLINFQLEITWKLDQRPLIPYSVEMKDQPESTEASITRITPFHPSSLLIIDSEGEGEFVELWWGESPLELNVSETIVETPTLQEKTESYVKSNPWLAIPILIILGIGLLVIIRKRNVIALDGEVCEACGSINPLDSISCSECGALFVYDQVMAKLHKWMLKHEMTVRSLFDKFDEDGNGTLETDELLNGLRSLRIAALPIAQMKALVNSIDIDGNGVIDFEEFEEAIGNAELEEDISEESAVVQESPPRPKRGPPSSKRNSPAKQEVVARRRRVDASEQVDGPITSSKRRRLDTAIPDEPEEKVIRKRKVVKMGEDNEQPVIRTKKVVKKVKPAKKRRKAVRRKK